VEVEHCGEMVDYLRKNATNGAVGFDTERVAFSDGQGPNTYPAALLQLCCDHKKAFLCPLHKWQEMPQPLLELLNDPSINKVASSVAGDVTWLKKRYPDNVALQGLTGGISNDHGFIDLKRHAQTLGDEGKKSLRMNNFALETMVEHILDLSINKLIDHSYWEVRLP